ncbi:hypothetical protein Zmor_019249 [Zophobas morio]|uniref:Nose resistant-to-fluoxetine protein N-terminal domain-containing protein n=1 Tax=Zophobas morio TaxID=2755281 RepID=A0AA38I1B3_9CUCU|nr:hypothetical protein Zmor_019249 [Zophobas morio]
METTLILFLTLSLTQGEVLLKLVKLQATKLITTSEIGENCAEDLSLLISDAFDLKLWALKMLDATSKINSGLWNGNAHFFGDYDQCLSIEHNTHNNTIRGQYCTAVLSVDPNVLNGDMQFLKLQHHVKIVNGLKFEGIFEHLKNASGGFGICVPKSCSPRDLATLLLNVKKKFKLPITLSFEEDLCVYKGEPSKISKLDVSVCYGLVLVVLLMCGSTIYDVYLQGSGVFRFLSVNRNMKKLLHQREDRTLNCVSGIKVISCFWVMLGHAAIGGTLLAKNIFYTVTEWRWKPMNTFVWTGHNAMDTFFTVSGLLVSYTYLKSSQKSSTGLFTFYTNRYVRLTPVMLLTILIQSSLLKIYVEGPYAKIMLDIFIEKCYDNWPSMVFYTINLFLHTKTVVTHIWYLSCDFQMYLLAPIFLFFIRKHPRKVTAAMALTFLLSVLYSFAITGIKKVGFTVYEWNQDFAYYLAFSTFHHLPSWLIGIFCGYLLQHENIKIPKNLNVCLLFVSFLSLIMLMVNQLTHLEGEYSVYRAALWNGLARPAWSLSLCYIIFSCATGHGGIVNSFLSNYVFIVLSELSYSIYLVHGGIMLFIFGNSRQTLFFNNHQILLYFMEICMWTLPLSLFTYLAFEAPILSIKNYMFKPKKSDSKEE